MTHRCIIVFVTAITICSCVMVEMKSDVTQLPFYNTSDFTPVWLSAASPGYNSIHSIPSFSFINQLGDTVTEHTFHEKIYVANFFFTACPAVCKQLTKGMIEVQNNYKGDEDVLLISHSVTPERDSIKVLAAYAKQYNIISSKWHLVTGNRNEIYRLARQSYFADEDLGLQRTEEDFLHTENILLIDKKRRIRGVYKGTDALEIKNLIADIKELKKEG